MQAPNKTKKSRLFDRLEKLRSVQQLTWAQVAEKLGVKVAMLMMVKGGQRNLSERVLTRLEWAEFEAGLKLKSQLSEPAKAFGNREKSSGPPITEKDIEKGYFDFHAEYTSGAIGPTVVRLTRPDAPARNRLGLIMAKSFDSDIVILACVPNDKRNESFLQDLTLSSRMSLHNAVMTLVFGKQWRTTVANLAVENRIGDRTSIDQILGKSTQS